jgi:hypothetical protein
MTNQPTIEIVAGEQPELVAELVALQKHAFPPQMQFREPERYYAASLRDRRNINLVLKAPDGKVAGYLLALPQSGVCRELQQWDPEMTEDPGGMYVDIIQTLPGRRQASWFMGLVAGLCGETRRRGHQRLAMHVRTSNGLSRLTRKILPASQCLRHIDDWFATGEPFDYIEAVPHLRRSEN